MNVSQKYPLLAKIRAFKSLSDQSKTQIKNLSYKRNPEILEGWKPCVCLFVFTHITSTIVQTVDG